MAIKVSNLLNNDRVEMSFEDQSILFGYCVSQLAVLQVDMLNGLGVGDEAYLAAHRISHIHKVMEASISRHEESRRREVLSLPLSLGKWRVRDALCGPDHAFILGLFESDSVMEMLSDRPKALVRKDTFAEVKSGDVEMKQMFI